MEKIISLVFAKALERNRDVLNRAWNMARAINRSLDQDRFFTVLAEYVDPLVEVVPAESEAVIDRVVEALYGAALDLTGGEHLGDMSRSPLVGRVWKKLFPKLAPFLVENPRLLAASLSNAAVNLNAEPGADGERWLTMLGHLSGRCRDVKELLRIGQVLAWRCGLARYRDSARNVWGSLPEELVFEVVGLNRYSEQMTGQRLRQLFEEPWPSVVSGEARQLLLMNRIGGFRGYGGRFITPPEAISDGERLYLFDRECCWSVYADCYGTSIIRFGPDLPPDIKTEGSSFRLLKDGSVNFNERRATLAILRDWSSYACVGKTMLVTLPDSFYVYVVGVTGEPA